MRTLLVISIALIGCSKEPACECRTVLQYTQHGTNMSQSWEDVGDWMPSESCRESTKTTFENWLTTTEIRECK